MRLETNNVKIIATGTMWWQQFLTNCYSLEREAWKSQHTLIQIEIPHLRVEFAELTIVTFKQIGGLLKETGNHAEGNVFINQV